MTIIKVKHVHHTGQNQKKVLLKNVFWDSIKNFRLFPFSLALLRSAKEEQLNRNNCDANDQIISTVMDFVCDDPDTLKYSIINLWLIVVFNTINLWKGFTSEDLCIYDLIFRL